MIDLEARRSTFGGSEIAAVLGVSRFATPLEVWANKTGAAEPKPQNRAMRSGSKLEGAILEDYLEAEGAKPLVFAPPTIAEPARSYLTANLDMIAGNEYGDAWNVDAKNIAWRDATEWGDPEDLDAIALPADEYWQALHYCFVTKRRRTDVAVMFGGTLPVRIYRVVADDAKYAELALPAVERMRELVTSNVPPPPDFIHPSTADLLQRMFPAKNRRKRVVVGYPESMLIDTLASMTELERRVKVRKAAVQNRIRHLMGDAHVMVDKQTGASVTRTDVRGGWVNAERKPHSRLTPRVGKEPRVSVEDCMEDL